MRLHHLLLLACLLLLPGIGLTWQPLHASPSLPAEDDSALTHPARSHHGTGSDSAGLRLGLIAGRVLLQGRSRHAGVQIILDDQVVALTDEDGRFVVRDVVPGSHRLTAHMPGYLPATLDHLSVSASGKVSLDAHPVTLLAGDLNGDQRVNVFDMAIVVAESRDAQASQRADLNADGSVNLLDLVLVSGNYGEVAPLRWSPAVPIPTQPAPLSPLAQRQGESTGALIEGWVTLQARSQHAGITVLLNNQPVATTDDDGHFVVEAVPPGRHTLAFEAPGFLASAPIRVTVATGQMATLPRDSLTLLAGDLNGDHAINSEDLSIIVASLGETSPEALAADLNGDGQVDMSDLVLAAGNADVTPAPPPTLVMGTPPPTATPVPATHTPSPMATPTPPATPTKASGTTAGQAAASAEQAQCTVQSATLNVRAGPGMAYAVVGVVPQGTVLHPEKRNPTGDWLLVSVPDPNQGWVAARYVTCNLALEELEVESVVPPETTPVPTATPTLYPAPVLLDPPDGHTFVGEVTLSWTWSGQLGPDEHFDVQVWRPGTTPRGVGWSDTGTWTGRLYDGEGAYQWRVVVIRGRDGHWEANLSQPSQTRLLNYHRFERPKEKKTPKPVGATPPASPTPTSTPWPTEAPAPTITPSPTAFTATPTVSPPPTSGTVTPPTPTASVTPTPTNTVPAPPTTTPTMTAYPPPPSPSPTAYPAPVQVNGPTPAESGAEPSPTPQPVPTPQT